jgi:hypothetical protein
MPPTWSWKRALAHAGLALVGTILVGAAAFALLKRPDSDDRQFGEGIGRLSVFVGAAAFAASWLAQTGRRRRAIAVAGGFALLVGGGLFAAILLAKPAHRARPLTALERAPLVVVDEGGARRLRHPAFGFSFLHPGPGFRDAPEVAAAMTGGRPDPETQTYGFVDPDAQSALVVSVMKGMGGSRDALAKHLAGVESGLAGSAAGGPGLRRLRNEVTWEDGHHVGRFGAVVAGDMQVELAAYSVEPADRPPFIVNMMITARQADRFKELLASFRP